MGKRWSRKRRIEFWTAVGALAAVAAIVVTIWLANRPPDDAEPVAEDSASSSETTPASDRPSPTESAETVIEDPPPSSPPAPASVGEPRVDVEVEKASNGWGVGLSKNRFALGDRGELDLDIEWAVYGAGGIKAEGDGNCEVRIHLAGPGGEQGKLFSSCSGITRGTFDGFPKGIDEAGTWTLTIEDVISEAQSVTELEVLAGTEF